MMLWVWRSTCVRLETKIQENNVRQAAFAAARWVWGSTFSVQRCNIGSSERFSVGGCRGACAEGRGHSMSQHGAPFSAGSGASASAKRWGGRPCSAASAADATSGGEPGARSKRMPA